MKIKTAELTGAALDWAVATALGYTRTTIHTVEFGKRVSKPAPWGFWDEVDGDTSRDGTFHPSTNWAQGGPIIEREGIELGSYADQWQAEMHLEDGSIFERGQTPLIAAMRCLIASKMGDKIEIPDDLLEN